jgi:hypothetical protein
MTEEEWLAATDPAPMLDFLRGKASDRKLVLLASIACRRMLEWYPLPLLALAVTRCERWADGRCAPTEMERLIQVFRPRIASSASRTRDPTHNLKSDAFFSVCCLVDLVNGIGGDNPTDPCQDVQIVICPISEMAPLVRDIFGNPARPVALDPAWLTSTATALARHPRLRSDADPG